MQINYIDWRSNSEVEQERLALTYHINSYHHPLLSVLNRSRMKELKRTYNQFQAELTPYKRYYSSPQYRLDDQELDAHPVLTAVMERYLELGSRAVPLMDFKLAEPLENSKLDSTDVYVLSKNRGSGEYELFYLNPQWGTVERVKPPVEFEESQLFDSSLRQERLEMVVFITANLFRSYKIFGERGYRLSLLEGGRVTERLVQCGHETGWRLIPATVFFDHYANGLLDLDAVYEAVLSCLSYSADLL